MWCVHNGKNTNAENCPYTKKTGLLCSMWHINTYEHLLRESEAFPQHTSRVEHMHLTTRSNRNTTCDKASTEAA